MKKTTLAAVALVVPVLALASCSSQATPAGGGDGAGSGNGTLTIAGFSGAFADQFEEFVIRPFEEETGIDVSYTPATNSSELLAELRSNPERPTYDIVIMDSSVATTANAEGLFAELDEDIVSDYDELVDDAIVSEGYGPAITIDSLTIAYNPSMISDLPATWSDLAAGDYDGDLAFQVADTRGIALIAALSKELGVDYRDGIDEQLGVMADIAQNAQTYEPQPNVYDAIRSGSVAMGLGWNARTQVLAEDSPEEIASYVPEGGGVAQISTINLVSTSENAEQAQEFINYAIGAEAQTALAEEGYYGPVNANVTLPSDLAPLVAVEDGIMADAAEIDWQWISQYYADWVERIQREVLVG